MTVSPQLEEERTTSFDLEKYFPLIVCLVAAVTFAATLRFEFIYDDNQQVLNNPLIRSWHSFPLLFKTDVWRFWNPGVVGNYWRPLFMVWLLLNYKLFGLNPAGWHLTAVLVHTATTYLVYRFVKRLFDRPWLAATAALIFAVHPAHLETVAWVSGATDSLMALFFLAALLCFLNGWEAKSAVSNGWFLASGLLFACSLLCKEVAIVFPAIVVGCVVLCRRDTYSGVGGLIRRLIPPFAMYAAVMVAYWVSRHAALEGINHSRIQIGATALLLTWPSLLWFYVSHLFWPVGLSIYYDRPPVFAADWPHFWGPLLGIIAVVVALALAVPRERWRQAVFAAAMIVLPLLPAFALPALVPTDYAHDRYLYLPCLGFALLIGIVLQRFGDEKEPGTHSYSRSRLLATIAVVVALSAATSAQMVYWANDLLLFHRATEIAPGNLMGFDGLGRALLGRGRTIEAMQAFQQVIRADPQNWAALYNLGYNEFLNGNYREAESYLRRASTANVSDADTRALLAEALNHQSKFGEAEGTIRNALALRPYKPGYRRVLAESLLGQGKIDEARAAVEAELKAHPDDQESQALLRQLQTEVDAHTRH